MNYKKLPPKLQKSILALYEKHKSSYEVARLLKIDRNIVFRFLSLKKIKMDGKSGPRNKKFIVNEDYFARIDTAEKAYWLGFIAADGCVFRSKGGSYSLEIGLKRSDQNHLEKFKICIGSDHSIFTRPNFTRGKKFYLSRIRIVNVKLCKDLMRLGIIPRKTFKLKFPTISKKLLSHYMRGYIDGDGCWSIRNRKIVPQISLKLVSAKKTFLTKFKKALIDNCLLNNNSIYKNKEGIYSFQYEGNDQCLRIVNFLYNGSTISLTRKEKLIFSHF